MLCLSSNIIMEKVKYYNFIKRLSIYLTKTTLKKL